MKKVLIKNILKITFIILFACLCTYFIYNKFHNDRHIEYSSESLDIIFREDTGDKITLDKVTPLNDSVGLASKSYEFSIKNNLTEKIDATIKLKKDEEAIEKDGCINTLIPEQYIKVVIKEGNKVSEIKTVNQLVDGLLLETTINPLESRNYNIRVWTSNDMKETNENLHYHGRIQVLENNNLLARR